MRITKRQLRRIIREEKARLLEDDKYAQLPPTSHERVTGMPSEFVEDNWLPWLEERGLGAEDLDDLARFTGAPDRSWLSAAPPADGMDGPADLELWARNKKAGIKESKMKITKRQLRRIIREAVINEALPPHLKKHFNKDGSAKVHNPMGYVIKDVTPAGYGPDDSVYDQPSYDLGLSTKEGLRTPLAKLLASVARSEPAGFEPRSREDIDMMLDLKEKGLVNYGLDPRGGHRGHITDLGRKGIQNI